MANRPLITEQQNPASARLDEMPVESILYLMNQEGRRVPEAVDVIVAGLTGFDGAPETAGAVADGVRTLVRTGRVVVTNDAVTSYLGAMGFEPGAVVAAGTGVIALAGDRDGSFSRSDG